MSLNIKNPDAERLVRELTEQTGEGVTEAVTVAVRERLERLARLRQDDPGSRATRIRQIARDAGGRWRTAARSTEHGDLLYDERGLPR